MFSVNLAKNANQLAWLCLKTSLLLGRFLLCHIWSSTKRLIMEVVSDLSNVEMFKDYEVTMYIKWSWENMENTYILLIKIVKILMTIILCYYMNKKICLKIDTLSIIFYWNVFCKDSSSTNKIIMCESLKKDNKNQPSIQYRKKKKWKDTSGWLQICIVPFYSIRRFYFHKLKLFL